MADKDSVAAILKKGEFDSGGEGEECSSVQPIQLDNPSDGDIGFEHRTDFKNVYQFAVDKKDFLVDYIRLLRYFARNEMPVVLPRSLVTTVPSCGYIVRISLGFMV